MSETRRDDAGIGLVEIVVAMFLLALVALALLPQFLTELKLTSTSSDVVTGSRLVAAELARARGAVGTSPTTCAAVTAFARGVGAGDAVTAGTGDRLVPAAQVTCPAAVPGTATLTVTVTASATTIASASTLIWVKS